MFGDLGGDGRGGGVRFRLAVVFGQLFQRLGKIGLIGDSDLPQPAVFFFSGRSTRRGGMASVTLSGVTTISRTSSREGISNMISRMTSSSTARRPRAPVPRFRARFATDRRASGSKVRPMPSFAAYFASFLGGSGLIAQISAPRLSKASRFCCSSPS